MRSRQERAAGSSARSNRQHEKRPATLEKAILSADVGSLHGYGHDSENPNDNPMIISNITIAVS
jgi:hypothetical protein